MTESARSARILEWARSARQLYGPPNSLVLVGDADGEPPDSMEGRSAAATSSCVAIGTRSEEDGATHVRLLDGPIDQADVPGVLAFEGRVDLPSSRLAVFSMYWEPYLEREVETSAAAVQVWSNDATEPDEIAVLIA